ncbi:MAG: acyl-CoA dehydrogenase [Nocardiopsaceae bacterium]|nr:acyl-CoA dehydrogenase [Nocardiopsaceae bacterium]
MDFSFTVEQHDFAAAVAELLRTHCTPEHVRATKSGFDRDRWKRLADIGMASVCVPEPHGGLGGDDLDLLLAVEECGSAALPEPVVESTTAATALGAAMESGARDGGHADHAVLLARAAEGDALLTVSAPTDPYVAAADHAAALLLEREGAWYVVDRDRAALTPQPSVDAPRTLFTVEWDSDGGTLIARGEAARAMSAAVLNRGALLSGAYLLGAARRLIEMSVSYAKDRIQFGRPIGSFQAVKHHLADAFVAVEFARPQVWRAGYSLTSGAATADRDVSAAKASASAAAERAAAVALQVHGAIGYTHESDLHLWLTKVWALSRAWGNAEWHRGRVASSLIDQRLTARLP